MANIRDSLNTLASAIEELQQTQTVQEIEILDRSLSGNKINGGKITNFASNGIKDEAKTTVVLVKDDGLHVDAVHTPRIANKLSIGGDLKVEGEVHATKLHVDEISADVRNERTSPLEFKGEGSAAYGKGLVWTGGDYTKQLVLQSGPDRVWSTEHIDVNGGKEYKINGGTVLSENSLGSTVVNSNLRRLGTLERLTVSGEVRIDDFINYDSGTERLGLGTEVPNGMLALASFDHEFVIDPTEAKQWKIGTYSTSELQIITDDTPRITIGPNGHVRVMNKTSFMQKVGIGVNNFAEDVDLTVSGAVRIEGKKFEVGVDIPSSGSYVKGDIVWNANPQPGGYVGWICVREGTPGEWKPFATISK
jgi:hypothetical protein